MPNAADSPADNAFSLTLSAGSPFVIALRLAIVMAFVAAVIAALPTVGFALIILLTVLGATGATGPGGETGGTGGTGSGAVVVVIIFAGPK